MSQRSGWRPFRRLRTRITVLASVVTLAIMVVTALAMLEFQERQVFEAVDESLNDSIDQIQTELEIDFGRGDGNARRRGNPGATLDLIERVKFSSLPVQLIDRDDDVLAVSPDLSRERALTTAEEVRGGRGRGTDFDTVRGRFARYRIAAVDISDEVEGVTLVVAAYSLRDVDRSLDSQRMTLLVAIPLLAGLVGLLIWLALGRALQPVEAIREQVAGITGQRLDRRVPVPEQSVELADLATTMNDMLDRLDESAARQNRFVSDAAHELRSPLAGIRGQLEVNVHHPDAPDRAESERAVLAETVRMQELVDNLLLLARADHGTYQPTMTEVDLDDLVFDEAATLRRSIEDGPITVRLDDVSAAQVVGDASQLRRVIRNLADNAARHATSEVRFELAETPHAVRLAVADDGPGVPPAEMEAVFDRFTRLDEARGRDAGGAGLGLAISREIVERHGGAIVVDPTHRPGARFVVTLPLPAGDR